jgi:integrase
MRFYQDKATKLWAYRREVDGRQFRRKGFDTKAQAVLALETAIAEYRANPTGKVEAKPTTLSDAYDIYAAKTAVNQAKRNDYYYTKSTEDVLRKCKSFVERVGMDKLVTETTVSDIEGWAISLTTCSPRTQKTYAAHVLGMLRAAKDARNDLVNWRVPKVSLSKGDPHETRAITEHEFKALLAALRARCGDAYDAIILLRSTGARLNEILKARWKDVNLVRQEIRLSGTKTFTPRTVPLPPIAIEVLKSRKSEGEFIFDRATFPTFKASITRAVAEASAKAGLNYGRVKDGFTIHSTRHAYITELLSRGVDMATVMKLSGHKSLESFAVYLHETDTGIKLARNVLAGLSVDGFLTADKVQQGVLRESGDNLNLAESQKTLRKIA